ncbi:MAG: ArgE/DapE family deacylase [Gemmatimonadaceae bacterium]
MTVPFANAAALARELVRVDSRNPTLVGGAPGERAVARVLSDVLTAWGLSVEVRDVVPGRPNVIARGGSPGAGRSLMLNGHLDVVGTEGMSHPPFDGEMRDGRLYGRGSADMKGGVAAMCTAAARAARAADAGALGGEVVVAAVVDEEYESLGTRALLDWGLRADAAIVTEPTRLAIMPAHRGFVWVEIVVRGRAAHGSRYDLGVDAIRGAALVMAELDRMERVDLVRRTHPLLGRASLHGSQIEGGVGWSTYPEHCALRVERRTLPGETTLAVVREIEEGIARVRADRVELDATVHLATAQSPSDVASSAPIVRALEASLRDSAEEVRVEGMSAWTDAALLNERGIPAICFGPGDITLAHAAEEWIAVAEIERATAVLERLVRGWCSATGG